MLTPITTAAKLTTGSFTLPSEAGMEELTVQLMKKWGADAIRNSDGTNLSRELSGMGAAVYSTLCMVREDKKWTKAHRDQLQQKYLMSDPKTATGGRLDIDLLAGWFRDQFEVDGIHDPKRWWQVIDRNTGETVAHGDWTFHRDSGTVMIDKTSKWHSYTVNFLVYQIWDPVSMYNHLTNNWTGEHTASVDPRHPETRRHLAEFLEQWLKDNPGTDVVRLTSMMYNFTYNFGENRKQKYFDWVGYHDCVSVPALDQFEEEYGYRLLPEDFVDEGYYNSTHRVPSQRYLDWMDFVQRFVTEVGAEWVSLIHRAGKEAMLFFCDHWIGTEPYGKYFDRLNLDGIVNPGGREMDFRRLAEVPGKLTREVRLSPYFFPTGMAGEPVFMEGGDPVASCRDAWMPVRRAMLRKHVDRIGFGGYLSLAAKFPDFLDYVEHLANEFRAFHEFSGKTPAYTAPFKVGVLNAWGKLRSWTHEEFCGAFAMDCLAGLPFEVVFLNFDDIANNGVPADVGVLINSGNAGTSWSGGRHWGQPKVVESIREWVAAGGGFIGMGEPAAFEANGRFFQLADVLGVEKELGYSKYTTKPVGRMEESHFIMADVQGELTFKRHADGVYPFSNSTGILADKDGDVIAATNTFGKGRALYFAGFDGDRFQISRLLHRSLYWAANREKELHRWFTSDIHTDCAAFPEAGNVAVTNSIAEERTTDIFDDTGNATAVTVPPYGIRWLRMAG